MYFSREETDSPPKLVSMVSAPNHCFVSLVTGKQVSDTDRGRSAPVSLGTNNSFVDSEPCGNWVSPEEGKKFISNSDAAGGPRIICVDTNPVSLERVLSVSCHQSQSQLSLIFALLALAVGWGFNEFSSAILYPWLVTSRGKARKPDLPLNAFRHWPGFCYE